MVARVIDHLAADFHSEFPYVRGFPLIFQIADYGLIGAPFAVLPELDAELAKAGE
ncbi:hypothetical protein [Bosea sp. UC22_33]|uniref:hypothetical protein n=1 Tax=Bosea sp. UC22_33 TaxID=3350165 RepID=UPI0036732EBD